MIDPSANTLRTLLGENLQGAAMRVVLIMGAISAVGATLAWLIL